MLIKTNEFNQDINDMYFFRIVDKTIIINDNYSGVFILNENFAILKTLKLLEGIVIYSSYVNSINKEILLYCPDNEAIVYINLENYMYLESGKFSIMSGRTFQKKNFKKIQKKVDTTPKMCGRSDF